MRRAIFPLLTLVFSCTFSVPGAQAAGGEPHEFMSDINRCATCHEKVPDPRVDDASTVVLKKDIVTLCEECHHAMIQSDKHPVDIRPDRPVPAELLLDNYFSITCATCHDPHGQAWADFPFVTYTWLDRLGRYFRGEKRHRTFFLRKTNVEGELCLSCHTRSNLLAAEGRVVVPAESLYVGSEKCRECHDEVWGQWKNSVHARFVGDARRDPRVIKGKFEGESPFPPRNLLFTLGEHWTQRYVVEGKADPMVRPEIWSIQSSQWISSGTYERSWYRYCAGCHTTGFNPFSGTWAEAGIGCESCHGPGKKHAESTDQFEIVNPAKLTEIRRDMICESCHTSGHDRTGLYRFPVGYRPGDDLMKFYSGLIPKPGQETDTYKGDGTYEDRHRQYEYWMARYNITQGILCDVCKNFRQTIEGGSGELFLSSSEFCATCHSWYWSNFRSHSKHDLGQVECIQCHTPLLSRDRRSYSIHDHKFQFGKPVYDEDLTLEMRCRHCHGAEAKLGFSPARERE